MENMSKRGSHVTDGLAPAERSIKLPKLPSRVLEAQASSYQACS